MGKPWRNLKSRKKIFSLEEKTMEFDYELEKDKLKKKLYMVLGLTLLFMFIICVIGKTAIGWGLLTSLGLAMIFYVPGRLREKLKMGWVLTIVIAVAYMFLYIWLLNRIGNFVVLLFLLPLADIGYTVYKLKSYKNR